MYDIEAAVARIDKLDAEAARRNQNNHHTLAYSGDHTHLLDALDAIPCDSTDHETWMKVGTALKASGVAFEEFEAWSSTDTRPGQYQGPRFTRSQWNSFDVNSGPTSGYIIRLAESHGWTQPNDQGKHYDGNEPLELNQVIKDEPFQPTQTNQPPANENTNANAGAKRSLFDALNARLLHTDQLTGVNRRPKPRFIVEGLISEKSVNMIAAPSKQCKSWAALSLCWSIANGRPWMGHFKCSPGRVLYIDIELGEDWMSQRLDDMKLRERYEMGFHVMSLKGNASTTLSNLREWLVCDHSNDYDLVVIDPLYLFEEGEENAAETWIPIMGELQVIQVECSCAVVYVHHFIKAWYNQPPENRPAGSGVIGRFYEQAMIFSPRQVDSIGEFTLRTEHGDKARAYEFFTMSRNYDDAEVKSCVWSWPRFIADVAHEYDEYPVTGSTEANRLVGSTHSKDRNEREWRTKDEAVGKAVEKCREAEEPSTRANVHRYLERVCESLGIEHPTMDTFKKWTSNGGRTHWRCDPQRGYELHAVDIDRMDEDGCAPFLPTPEQGG